VSTQRLAIKSGEHGAVIVAAHFDAIMSRVWEATLSEAPPMDGGVVTCTGGMEDAPGRLSTSKHPLRRALDFGSKGISAADLTARRAALNLWADRVRARLPAAYDVVPRFYIETPDRDHLHLEFDHEQGEEIKMDAETQAEIRAAVAEAMTAGSAVKPKPAYASKGVLGGLGSFLAGLAGLALMAQGADPATVAESTAQIGNGVQEIAPHVVAAVAGVLAVWGRLAAVARIR